MRISSYVVDNNSNAVLDKELIDEITEYVTGHLLSEMEAGAFLFGADDSFSIKIGGTVYDGTTHFNPEGKQTVLQQFMALLQEQEPLHI